MSDNQLSERDWFLIEAAEQYGFDPIDDDCTEYKCTLEQIAKFVAGCERAGLWQASQLAENRAKQYDREHCCQENALAGECDVIATAISVKVAEHDAVLLPYLEAERIKRLTAIGYVRSENGQWVRPAVEATS